MGQELVPYLADLEWGSTGLLQEGNSLNLKYLNKLCCEWMLSYPQKIKKKLFADKAVQESTSEVKKKKKSLLQ